MTDIGKSIAYTLAVIMAQVDKNDGIPVEQTDIDRLVISMTHQIDIGLVAWLLSFEVVELVARNFEPSLWDKIDKWIADDDWNGATALNAQAQSINRARVALNALVSTLGRKSALDEAKQ